MDDIRQILDKNTKPQKTAQPISDWGKLPPQATDLEEAILGALMLESEAFDKAGSLLKTEIFYKPNHQKVCNAIIALAEKNEPIDILTVTNKLKALGDLDIIGGPKFIADLTSRVGSAVNIEYHVKIVYEKFLKREVIRIASLMTNIAFDEETDAFDLIDEYQSLLEKLVKFDSSDFSPKKRLQEARDATYRAHNSETGLSGVSTGYDSMDQFTGGLQPGDLIIIGGFPGTFKSALTLAIQHNAEAAGVPTFMFEQEMSGRQVGMREIAIHTGISTENLKNGKVSQEELQMMEEAIGRIEKKKVFMDLSSGIKASKIKSTLRKMVKEESVGLAVIDYLGLCDLEDKKHGGREQAIDNFLREMKNLAKELDIPIIVLAQFLKMDNKAKLEVPHSGLLKGSGSIEAHADCVWLLWNPSKIDRHHQYDYMDGSGPFSTFGKLGVMYEKNRQGSIGLQFIGVQPENNRFNDL